MDVFVIYERLWKLAQGENVLVEYRALDNGEAGYFHAHAGEFFPSGKPRRPELAINRWWAKSPCTEPTRESNAPAGKPQPDLLSELIALAHEIGHMFSWKGRTNPDEWAKYAEIQKRRDEIARAFDLEADAAQLVDPERTRRLGARMLETFNDIERARIVKEEVLASAIGRELLESHGFDRFEAYDEHAGRSLHNHRVKLGIDEITAADLEAAGFVVA